MPLPRLFFLGWLCLATGCQSSSTPPRLAEDAGQMDAGQTDATPPDAATDATPPDATLPDAALPDAALPDATLPDAALPDATLPDVDCPDPAVLLADFRATYPNLALNAQMHSAVQAFVDSEAAICRGDFAAANATLAAVWARYPVGMPSWNAAWNAGSGVNLGTPVGYYGLRMLQTIVDHGLSGATPPVRTVRLGVALPGCSEGIEPRTAEERAAGEGIRVRHALEPSLLEDDSAVIRESFDLFNRYIFAATQGRLQVELAFHSLPNVCVPVSVSRAAPPVASIGSTAPVFDALPAEVEAATDWWIIIYPSHVPEQHPDFAGQEFISGGMGRAPNGGPLFLGDDRWFVRKPPHLGDGPYTHLERRMYLPQWLQHEFFHHLFQIFPEHGLEDESHQWFNRQTWPADFVGVYEPDYYAEALTKRLHRSDPPLHVRLRYAVGDVDWSQVARADVVGTYVRMPEENPWHRGTISEDGANLRWTNMAGVSWGLGDAINQGRLVGGADNPYFGQQDVDFYLELTRDALGDSALPIRGFRFGGELYRRID